MRKITAYCGNTCTSCPRFLATFNNNREQLQAVRSLWVKTELRDESVIADDLKCRGCTSATHCRHGIRECAQSKKIQTCAECGEYPCSKLSLAFDRTAEFACECKKKCTPEEFASLNDSMLQKKATLEKYKK